MAGSVLDQYPQWALLRVAGSAAATGTTVTQLTTGISNLQKVAWECLRLEYWFPYAWFDKSYMLTAPKYIIAGVTQSASTAQNATPDNASLVDWLAFGGAMEMTAVGEQRGLFNPITKDYSQNPILVLPQNLYAILNWDTTINLSTLVVFIKMWYKEKELGPADWYDLLQLRMPLGAT